VYVYYDPEVSKQLELGKLTALWELQWVQHVRAHVSPRLRYYYMGFYVRSCQKMRYKVGSERVDVCVCHESMAFGCGTAQSVCPISEELGCIHPGWLPPAKPVFKFNCSCVRRVSGPGMAVPSHHSDDTSLLLYTSPFFPAPPQGEYAPSDLLCPHTWRWVPLADCAPLLDADKYAILDPAARASPSLVADERRQRLAAAAGAVPATPVFLRRVHADSLVLLRDLTEEGRRIVKDALLGLFERCTPELARRLAVQF